MEKSQVTGYETCGFVNIPVERKFGLKGQAAVQWRTLNYQVNHTGELTFKDGEFQKNITINIIDDEIELQNQSFEVELIPRKENEGQLRHMTKTVVNIDDNDGNNLYSITVLHNTYILLYNNTMYVTLTGQCCSKIEIYYKTKTKAFTKYWAFYGIYTRVNNENDHYVYRDTFANGFLGIWFCGTDWYIGQYSSKGDCLGFVNSNNNTNTCVHDIGFNWKYFNPPNWSDADESLSAKCLNEHGK